MLYMYTGYVVDALQNMYTKTWTVIFLICSVGIHFRPNKRANGNKTVLVLPINQLLNINNLIFPNNL